METHTELIKCPECGKIQMATVLHTFPWSSFVHRCTACEYIVMESEWEVVTEAEIKLD